MKATLVAVFLLMIASTALGQVSSGGSVLNSQPSVLTLPSHPVRASYAQMGQEQRLGERASYSFGHGERPLWEVAPPPKEEVPLGDVARALREAHLYARKAAFVKEN